MFSALTLKQLRSLRCVASTGSITDAAAEQSLSPPAIHSQIRKLEENLKVSVLTKDSADRSLVATVQGAVLISAMDRIDGALSWARDNLDALAAGNTGHVRIGFESTGRYFAPRLAKRLSELCPTIEISFDVANRTMVIEWLSTGRIDLAVMGRPPRQPLNDATPIAPHPYGLVVSPESELAGHQSYDPEALLAHTVLAREAGSGTRIILDRFLDQIEAYGVPNIVEFDSNETIKESVMAGLGVAMLSMHVVQRELEAGRLIALDWPRLPVMRYWYLVSRQTEHLPGSTARIRKAILGENGAFLREQRFSSLRS